MKLLMLVIVLLSMSFVKGWAQPDEDPFPPVAIPSDRYDGMASRSPFVLPTFDQEVSVTKTWASDFFIASILKIGDESVVIAKKVSTNERMAIRTKDNTQGIRLVSLHLSDDPREVSAVLEMGGIEGTIQYDPSALSLLPHSVAADNPAIKSE